MSRAKDSKNVRLFPVPRSTHDHPITFLSKGKCKCSYVSYTTKVIYDPETQQCKNERVSIGKLPYKLPKDWKGENGKDIEKNWPKEMIPNDFYKIYFPELAFLGPINEGGNGNEDDHASKGVEDSLDLDDIDLDDESFMYGDYVKLGTYLVVDQLAEKYELKKHLKSSGFTDVEILKILDFAAYMMIEEDNAALAFESYAAEHLLYNLTCGKSDATMGRLFNSLDEERIRKFFQQWNEANIKRHEEESKKNCVVYLGADGSNYPSQAGDIDLVEYGEAKVDDGNAIISFALIIDMITKIPVYYDEYAGSINDMTECIYLLRQVLAFGYKFIGFILDRGFFSKDIIEYFDSHGLAFIIMAKGWKRFIRHAVLEIVGTFERKDQFYNARYGVYCTTIKHELFGKERYMHVYYKPGMQKIDEAAFREKLKKWEKKLNALKESQIKVDRRGMKDIELYYNVIYGDKQQIIDFSKNEEEINNDLLLSGYFVIISALEMTATEALIMYKSRDVNEKCNMQIKTFLGCNTMRVESLPTLEGKNFVKFIALILRQTLYLELSEAENKLGKEVQDFQIPTAINILDQIHLTRYADDTYALRSALRSRQKRVLKACKISEEMAIQKISEHASRVNELYAEAKERAEKDK